MQLNQNLREDFSWWESNTEFQVLLVVNSVILYRGSSIINCEFSLVIFSNASFMGWGVSSNDNKVHGLWSLKGYIINYLELLSAFLGLNCFTKDLKSCNILLRIDNTTVISYINRMGGIRFKELSDLTKTIWK